MINWYAPALWLCLNCLHEFVQTSDDDPTCCDWCDCTHLQLLREEREV